LLLIKDKSTHIHQLRQDWSNHVVINSCLRFPTALFWSNTEELPNQWQEPGISTPVCLSLTLRNNAPLFVFYSYCNGFDERVARQQLRKHGSACNISGGCVFRVRDDVTQRWVVVTWHAFPVMRVRSLAI
jgi:hypothetical protein